MPSPKRLAPRDESDAIEGSSAARLVLVLQHPRRICRRERPSCRRPERRRRDPVDRFYAVCTAGLVDPGAGSVRAGADKALLAKYSSAEALQWTKVPCNVVEAGADHPRAGADDIAFVELVSDEGEVRRRARIVDDEKEATRSLGRIDEAEPQSMVAGDDVPSMKRVPVTARASKSRNARWGGWVRYAGRR